MNKVKIMIDSQFDDIRPYHDDEINSAMNRIADNPLFKSVADFLYPGKDVETLKTMFRKFNSINEFQVQVMHHAMHEIVRKTTNGLTCNGIKQLDANKSYLFISNHRDIILDSGFYQISLHDNGYKTSEITFGSNLMHPDFVVDAGKSNKMFKVERGGSPRDFYKNSKHLSDYMRFTITTKKESIWIAQRNGRTKDGNDMTDQGILKMFSMSGSCDLVENFSELNLAPLSVSYQYEPCIISKVRELYISKSQKYVKAPGEDLQSILTGLTQFKGKVHLEVTKPIEKAELLNFGSLPKTEFYAGLIELLDKRIQSNYRLFNTNYMGFDILYSTAKYLNVKYTIEELNSFISAIDKDIMQIEGDKNELKKIYLGIYANPVINYYKY